ncbi:hypothetical protein IWZ01DRAFT_552784 [Phyllosticta capitalensis]
MLAFPAPSLLIATLALAASAAGQAMNGTLDSNNTTVANATTNANTTWTTQPQPVTTNDYCGPQYGNMSCVIDGILPCCSSKGFCGGDKRYCGDGCQSAFGNCAIPNSTTLGNPACSWSDQGTSPRCDGQCGSDNNNARCDASFGPDALAEFGVFNYGPCCSSSGFCGNTSDHCEIQKGCQSGCTGGDPSSTSSAAATVTVTASASATNASATQTGVANVVAVPYSNAGVVLVFGALFAGLGL